MSNNKQKLNITKISTPSAKTMRNRRRRLARKAKVNSNPQYFSNDNNIMKASDTAMRRLQGISRNGLTEPGVSFLKCAFAPPDFAATNLAGVPDLYMGPRLIKKHRYVANKSFTINKDIWFVLAPVPGVAYYYLEKNAGTDIAFDDLFLPVDYSDKSSLFGVDLTDAATNIQKFRFISNHFELVSTVNQMQWTGSIQAWKVKVQVTTSTLSNNPNYLTTTVTGLEGLSQLSTTRANQYSGNFVSGFYGGAYSSECEFRYVPVFEGIKDIPSTDLDTGRFGSLTNNGNCPGFDNGFETLVIKVSGVTGSTNTALIKTWACVEYQLNSNSSLYEYQTLGYEDELALKIYRRVVNGLPVGVPSGMNDTFWQRVLKLVNGISAAGSFIPGPYGTISKGVNTITTGLNALYM